MSPPETKPPELKLIKPPKSARYRLPPLAKRDVGRWLSFLGVALDAAIIALVPLILVAIESFVTDKSFADTYEVLNLRLALLYVIVAVVMLQGTRRRGRLTPRPSDLLGQVAIALAIAPMITAVLTWWVDRVDKRLWVNLMLLSVPMVLTGRLVMFKLVQTVRRRGYDLEETLIVGAGSVGRDIAAAIEQNPDCGLVPVGFIDRFEERLSHPLVGRPEDLLAILEETDVRHVILGFGGATESEMVSYVRECAPLPVQFYSVPRFFELGVSAGQRGFEVDGFAVTPLGRPGRYHRLWWLKRTSDVLISALLLLLTSPLFLICALLVKLTSKGPVFFRQERVSIDHVPFDILKFRTMTWVADPTRQAELAHHSLKIDLDDSRITPVGRILRSSHLDEIPQLVNVLRGDMSIVGPRPEMPYFVDQLSREINGYANRHRVPAGITGLAQVNGFWGNSSLEARVRLDNRYIENWTPWTDLLIVLRTIPTVLGKRR